MVVEPQRRRVVFRLAAVWAMLCLTGGAAAQAPGPASTGAGVPPPPALAPPPLTPQEGQAIMRALDAARDQGFPSIDLSALVSALQAGDPATRDRANIGLTETAVRYARQQWAGRSDPGRRNEAWGMRAGPYDAEADFQEARKAGRLDAWFADLAPPNPAYKTLAAQYKRYRDIAVAGGWPSVSSTATSGKASAPLRKRLAIEGYPLGAAGRPNQADPGVAAAVGVFQSRHGLTPTGKVDTQTLAALNVPADVRAAEISANLERIRWAPRELPPNRVEVDIPSAEAVLYQDGVQALSMKVVVGKLKHETPILGSQIQSVIFNPPWNVPKSIAAKEILPKAAHDRGYLARHGYHWADGHIRQSPGAHNALGRIKFDFPNTYGVYLHDTPSKALFARDSRGLSHGCVRLEQPRALAQKILGSQGWTDEKIGDAIDAGKTRWVKVDQPVPVFIVYRTAFVDAAGDLNFRDDVYGWDAELSTIL